MIAEVSATISKSKTIQHSYWDYTKVYSLEKYFELEEKAPFKSEFRNGKIVTMSGGTIEHGDISGNIYLIMRLVIKTLSEKYRVFSNDQKIYIPAHNHSVYADTFVVKDSPEIHDKSSFSVTNPMIVFEVLSKSTANYDRSGKFRKYQTLASFQEYVLIDQTMPIVDVLVKTDEGWIMNTYIGLDALVPLKTMNCEIKMSDIYENVDNLKDPQTAMEF